jgi:hypothetical protein
MRSIYYLLQFESKIRKGVRDDGVRDTVLRHHEEGGKEESGQEEGNEEKIIEKSGPAGLVITRRIFFPLPRLSRSACED